MFKRDWTTPSNINDYSTLNIEHDWEDLCISLRNGQTRYIANVINQGKSNLRSGYRKCFIVDLLMRHKFHGDSIANW